MKEYRGKNFTVAQRKRLAEEGYSSQQLEKYLMKKISYKDGQEIWTLIERKTGRTMEVVV